MVTLYDFQLNSANYIIERLTNNKPVIDCSVVGAGKTFIALYSLKSVNKKFILICPKIVINHWKESIQFANIQHLCLDVLNYEKIKNGKTSFYKYENKIGKWTIDHNSIIVFDEAHKLKGYNTINSQLLISLKKQTHLIPYLLSATIANSPIDFLNVADALNLCYNKYKWLAEFGYKKRFDNKGWIFDNNEEHLINLHNILFNNPNHPGIRITYEDINILTNANHIHMTFVDDIYNKINRLYYLLDSNSLNINTNKNSCDDSVFNNIMKKTQNALLFNENCTEILEELEECIDEQYSDNILTKRTRLRQFIELIKSKLILSKILNDIQTGNSVVVMFNYSWSINLLYDLLTNLSIPCNIITGFSKNRDDVISQFQNNNLKVVILNIKAASVGISLHDTIGSFKRISYISPSENIYELEQALGRIYRATSKSDANQFIITVRDTIEESVYENYINKLKMMTKILNGNSNL